MRQQQSQQQQQLSSTSASATATPTVDAAIADEVPAAIKSKGTLTVASEAPYAPNEFVAADGHTVVGMDADLVNAIGAKMGLKVKFVNADFETIIPGLAAGRYDLGASSFTDTKEREKTVDFVDYFTAGISFYAKSSANPAVNTVADLCGKKVAVEKGTVEQEEATKQSGKCTKEGKKAVNVLGSPTRTGRTSRSPAGARNSAWPTRRSPPTRSSSRRRQFKLVGTDLRNGAVRPRDPEGSGMTHSRSRPR